MVRVKYSYKKIGQELKSKAFQETNKYNFIDTFLIPNQIGIRK